MKITEFGSLNFMKIGLDMGSTLLGVDRVISIGAETVMHARHLVRVHPGLTSRDLLHLATCQMNKIKDLKTFDRNLLATFKKS